MFRILTVALALSWVPTISVSAACSDRPGTPINLKVMVTGATTMEVSWTNTADETVFWDVEEREGFRQSDGTFRPGIVVFPHPAGVGKGDTGKGLRVSSTYTVPAGAIRCFRAKARTGSKTSGCVSQVWSNSDCAMTAPPPNSAPPKPGESDVKPGPKAGTLLDPSISVQWLQGDTFVVTGRHFTPNAHVFLKVTGQTKFDTIAFNSLDVKSPRRRPITATSAGELPVIRLSGVCNTGRPGDVTFIAHDPTKSPTKPVTQRCRGGADPTDNTKIKPKP